MGVPDALFLSVLILHSPMAQVPRSHEIACLSAVRVVAEYLVEATVPRTGHPLLLALA